MGNADTSTPDGGPDKPKGLPQVQSDVWDEIVPMLPGDALRQRDAFILYELTGIIAALRQINGEWLLDPKDKDLRCAKMQYMQKLIQLSGLLGLSPADRKRIQIDTPKEEKDELDEFIE
jgi:phage terminase small subunit